MALLRPRAAFVMTFSLLAGTACHKEGEGTFECKPPDCHINPPPTPTPTTTTSSAIEALPSGTTTAAPPVIPVASGSAAPTVTINANPPPLSPTIHRNPPPPKRDGGPLL